MELTSSQFLLFCIGVVVATNISTNIRYRAALLVGANCILIASYINSPVQLVGLAVLLAFGYIGICAVRRWPNWRVVTASVAVIIALFLYFKQYSFLSALPKLPFIYLTLGLSYILFRIIHLIVDTAEGDLKEAVKIVDYFNYTCNFLTFVSGPIQRFQEFSGDKKAGQAIGEIEAYEGFRRVAIGYFKVLAISAITNAVFQKLSVTVLAPTGAAWSSYCAHYVVCAGVYTIFLYYNFAGFIDVVIGFGKLIGLRLPENFNRPFQAGNFLDFWGRWHMTLSHWFRDYMFNPLLRTLMGRFNEPGVAPALGVLGFFITFLVMGVWHGATTVFIAYGLVMGAGASLNKAYQLWITARLGRKRYRSLCKSRIYIYICRGVTFAYFTMAVTALWVDVRQLVGIGHALGAVGLGGAFLGLTTLGTLALLASDVVGVGIARAASALRLADSNLMVRSVGIACVILLALAVNSLFSGPPEFVYRAF